jgi:hypothetical protein
MKRREFCELAAGLAGLAMPVIGRAELRPCPPSTVAVSGGVSVASNCTQGAVPAWLASVPAGQIAQLDFASATNSSIGAVTPREWIENPGYENVVNGVRKIIQAWSGGIGDSDHRRIYVHGTGHGDGGNNGLYCLDFSGDEKPIGWQLFGAPSSVAAADAGYRSNASVLADGRPAAVHTYDLVWMDNAVQRVYRTHGSLAGAGNETRKTWYFDVARRVWVNAHDCPFGFDLDASTLANPTARKTLMLRRNLYGIYRWDSGWQPQKYLTGDVGRNGTCISRPDASEGLMAAFGYGTGFSRVVPNWTSETVTISPVSLGGGSSLSRYGVTGFFEELTNSYWLFMPVEPGVSNTSMPAKYWQVDGRTWAVKEYDSGGTLDAYPSQPFGEQGAGHYKRHCFVPEWRSVVFVTDPLRSWVLRLPS